MLSLNDFKFLLPPIPTEEDWNKNINQLEGLEKEAAVIRARGYNLLEDFQETKVNFERIGWLNAWAKAMNALDTAFSAFQYGSDWVLQTLSRATFELEHHLLVIIEPIFDITQIKKSHKVVVPGRSHEYAERQTIERLRAYAAWCLWSDKVYFNELIHPMTLKGVWDPIPAKTILSNKEALEGHERLYGRLESEIDSEKLKQGRAEMELFYKNKIQQIDQWLEGAQLKKWYDMILMLSRENRRAVSFFNLFDPEATLAKRLKKHGVRFGYAQYSASSMGLHGSTMEQFVFFDDAVVAPKLQMDKKADEALFKGVISDCNSLFVLLGMMNHYVLKKAEK